MGAKRPRTAKVRRKPWGLGFWSGRIAEAAIVITSVVYVFTSELWALATWEILAIIYLTVGLALAWNGAPGPRAHRDEARAAVRWSWILPLVSSFAGVNSAVLALIARGSGTYDDTILAVAASAGVVLSWALLHTGFAHMYESIDAVGDHAELRFPGKSGVTFMNYLYFSFTIGTSFATSDAGILTIRTRRVALIHGIISFFYNALVVAVAFQVLQHAVAQS